MAKMKLNHLPIDLDTFFCFCIACVWWGSHILNISFCPCHVPLASLCRLVTGGLMCKGNLHMCVFMGVCGSCMDLDRWTTAATQWYSKTALSSCRSAKQKCEKVSDRDNKRPSAKCLCQMWWGRLDKPGENSYTTLITLYGAVHQSLH